MHYLEHKEKPFFEDLISHLMGKLHNNSKVIAIVYEGENAIEKMRKLTGDTNPEKADFRTLRGKYGRINSQTKCHETVIHSSDSEKSAQREISLWFRSDELIE